MRHVLSGIVLAFVLLSGGVAQAQPVRPPQARSAISTEIDFDRPGATYQSSKLALGAGGSILDARGKCRLSCYTASQCRAYSVHRAGDVAICEMKNNPPKPVNRKGYVSGRRIPPVRVGNDDGTPPTEADPPFGVDSCRRLELKCPGPSELAVVKGSCVCQVKRLNTPIEIGPDRQ